MIEIQNPQIKVSWIPTVLMSRTDISVMICTFIPV